MAGIIIKEGTFLYAFGVNPVSMDTLWVPLPYCTTTTNTCLPSIICTLGLN